MKMRFLCASHRAELSDKSSRAINCWQNAFDTGQLFFEQKLWRDALPHLGCAFESAEIIMSTNAIDRFHAYELFTCSALLLTNTFVQLDFAKHGYDICSLSITRLERELNHSPKAKHSIKLHLNLLYQRLYQFDALPASHRLHSSNKINNHNKKPLQQYTIEKNH